MKRKDVGCPQACPIAMVLVHCQSHWRQSIPPLLKARQKFFGIDNVDVNTGAVKKDKVIASWATNTTYVTSILGRVVLLDSYISRPELPTSPIDRRYAPVLPQDFIDVRPEAIFLGHGHGDHADNAAYIAKWTNAMIYATPETCARDRSRTSRGWRPTRITQTAACRTFRMPTPVNCVGVVPRGSRPGQYNEGPNAGLLEEQRHQACHAARFAGLRSRVQVRPLGNGARRSVLSRTPR